MIKYELTLEDFTRYNNYYLANNAPFITKYRRYIYLIFPVIFFYNLKDLLFSKAYWGRIDFFTFVPFIAFTFFLFLFFRTSRYSKRYSKKYFKNNPYAFGNYEITLMDDKLILKTEKINSEINYSSFLGRVEEADYFFLLMSKSNAIIIPKVAIVDKADEMLIRNKINIYTT